MYKPQYVNLGKVNRYKGKMRTIYYNKSVLVYAKKVNNGINILYKIDSREL